MGVSLSVQGPSAEDGLARRAPRGGRRQAQRDKRRTSMIALDTTSPSPLGLESSSHASARSAISAFAQTHSSSFQHQLRMYVLVQPKIEQRYRRLPLGPHGRLLLAPRPRCSRLRGCKHSRPPLLHIIKR
jgi:hypothetical protein